jgi:flagellar biogenesis protein FliO|tara:strand:- start:429 stop:608 length:180 start_codon:yes stop_codon:yes gene_type:complete
MEFTKNTRSSKSLFSLILKVGIVIALFLVAIFLLSKIDFPAPKKEIEKIIPNENFKIVK